MNHHQFYPWTYVLPDGRLFIAGPHDPTHRFDLAAPAAAETFATINGNRSTGGEKGTSVLLMLRPPDYKPVVYIIGGNPPATQKTAEMIDLSAADARMDRAAQPERGARPSSSRRRCCRTAACSSPAA